MASWVEHESIRGWRGARCAAKTALRLLRGFFIENHCDTVWFGLGGGRLRRVAESLIGEASENVLRRVALLRTELLPKGLAQIGFFRQV